MLRSICTQEQNSCQVAVLLSGPTICSTITGSDLATIELEVEALDGVFTSPDARESPASAK